MNTITDLELAPFIYPHAIGIWEHIMTTLVLLDNKDSGDSSQTVYTNYFEDEEPVTPNIDFHVTEFIKIRNPYGIELPPNRNLDESTIHAVSEKLSLSLSMFDSK